MNGANNKDDDKNQRISVFKEVFSRHKRKGKDPNRIDDLFDINGENGGVIDVSLFENYHVRTRSRKRPRGQIAITTECDNKGTNDPIGDHSEICNNNEMTNPPSCFGQGVVYPINSSIDLRHNGDISDYKNFHGYGFSEFPGVYLYPRALSQDLQKELAYQAVTEYCELSGDTNDRHRTNIDLIPPKTTERVNQTGNPKESMWNLWKQEQKLADGSEKDSRSELRSPHHPEEKKPNHKNKKKNNEAIFYRRFSKLSWATMGYHYDWTERSYNPQKKSTMPELVARLSTLFATANHEGSTGLSNGIPRSTMVPSFTPSASIVNYYTAKSTMGGHRDDLEDQKAMDKPIVSISLGLPGVFILGGPNKEEYDSSTHPVRAILLRRGDVLVMGGNSRLNYHAMARVLPYDAAIAYDRRVRTIEGHTVERDCGKSENCDDNCSASFGHAVTLQDLFPLKSGETVNDSTFTALQLTGENKDINDEHRYKKEREFLNEYLRHHRVNINVRQVYPDRNNVQDQRILSIPYENTKE